MAATRLCREDTGKLIDALKKVQELLEDLGLEEGTVEFTRDGNIVSKFSLDTNHLDLKVLDNGKTEITAYEK